MQYLEYFSYVSVLGFAFFYIFSYVTNIVQIPFAFIHRYAVYLVLLVSTYFSSLFFSEFARSAVNNHGLSPAIIIFNAFLIFFLTLFSYADTIRGRAHHDFVSFLPILSFVLTLVAFIFKVRFLSPVTDFILYFLDKLLYATPFGGVIQFIICPIGGIVAACILGYYVVVWTIGIISSLFNR